MKRSSKWQVLGLFLMVGCGGADSDRSTMPPTAPTPDQETATSERQEPALDQEPYTPPAPPPADVTAPGTAAQGPAGSAAPQAATPMPTPTAKPDESPTTARASADIKAVKGDASVGTITFEERDGKIYIMGQFTGLPPGPHGFHIHEKGSCANKGKAAGNHLNPTKAKHGPPESPTRHAGDFGNLVADKDGNASFEMETDSLTVKPGADSVAGRAIVIHLKKDDGKSQPAGNAGPAFACGVIQASEAGAPTAP